MSTTTDPGPVGTDAEKAALDKRLEEVGWGLLLVMTGMIWLVPGDRVPPGTWLLGTGVLLLGLNLVRSFNGIRMNGFTTFLGVLALAAGLGDVFGIELPLFAICIIIVGLAMVVRPMMGRAR